MKNMIEGAKFSKFPSILRLRVFDIINGIQLSVTSIGIYHI
jgi:hypothetical protein